MKTELEWKKFDRKGGLEPRQSDICICIGDFVLNGELKRAVRVLSFWPGEKCPWGEENRDFVVRYFALFVFPGLNL